MKKLYKINQFTAEQWDGIEYDWNEHEDEIVIIEKKDAYCMDITANGKRIVPILRKIEEAMTAAGLAGDNGIYAGWFGEWANELTGSYFDRKNFIWEYSGRSDRERGCWSYSWSIEQIDEDRWYIFLNIAKPTQPAEQEQEAPAETEQATEEATPATTTTEAAPLQLETLAARLDRMTAAELVELYAATSAPGSIDDETDSAIYDALRASNPRAYRVWMKYSIEYIPGDPASIEAANAADVEHLRAAYGVTA